MDKFMGTIFVCNNVKAEEVLNEIESLEKIRSELDQKIDNINEELKDKDSDQLVTAAEWSLKKGWKFFTLWQEEKVECVSMANCRIHQVG